MPRVLSLPSARPSPPALGVGQVVLIVLLVWPFSGCERSKSPGPLELVDLSGRKVNPFGMQGESAKVNVFLFTRADCPISNRYAPQVQKLWEEYTSRGVQFWLVYPHPQQTLEGIRQHMREYGYSCSALLDPQHKLVSLSGASVTPEAAVYTKTKRLAYRGRIDDRYVKLGTAKVKASRNDLQEALEAVLSGRDVERPRTKAVGCYISDLK